MTPAGRSPRWQGWGALGAAELGFGYVKDSWVYLTDMRDAEAVLGVAAEVMPEGAPVQTVAGLTLVGRLGVEIQVAAMVR